MIPKETQRAFDLIDFLNQNKEEFAKYHPNIDKLHSLRSKQFKLNPWERYNDEEPYNDLEKQIKREWDIISENVTNLINKRIADLGIEEAYNKWCFGHINELRQAKEKEDIPVIKKHISDYNLFRKSGYNYLSFGFFFDDLDQFIAKIAEWLGVEFDPNKDWETNGLKEAPFEDKASKENKETTPETKLIKKEAKHYALAYFFEKGDERPLKQIEFEKVLEEYSNKAKSGNTIRKKYNDIESTKPASNMYSKAYLMAGYGDDWRDIVLSIAHEKEKLDSYLKSRHL